MYIYIYIYAHMPETNRQHLEHVLIRDFSHYSHSDRDFDYKIHNTIVNYVCCYFYVYCLFSFEYILVKNNKENDDEGRKG